MVVRSNLLKLLVCLVLVSATAECAYAGDDDAILKLDIPKYDLTIPKSDKLLKGGVQHSEAQKQGRISGDAAKANIDLGATKKKRERFGLFGLGRPDNSRNLKSNLRNDALNSQIESGIGIIGVKFVLGFGRPPIINRVFPGTPAYNSGLRVNDIIVAVDGIPTSGLTKEEVYNMIVGTPNTMVTVSVARGGDFLARTMTRMDFNDIADPGVRRDYLLNM